MGKDNEYELDDLDKYEKKDLLGEPFVVDHITSAYLGDNGFFKLMFLKVNSDKVNGFTFISANSALDKTGVIGIPVTIEEVTSKNKYTYYKYTEPDLSKGQQKITENNTPKKSRKKD